MTADIRPLLKVLFLPRWYPNRNDLLDGNFIENHAIAVNGRCQLAVLFVCPDENIINGSYEVVVGCEFGFTVVRVYYKKVRSSLPVWSHFLKVYRTFGSYIRGYRVVEKQMGVPELVHVHVLTKPGIVALVLKCLKNIPYLITEHWTGYQPQRNEFKGFFNRMLTRWVVRGAAAITTVSKDLQKAMEHHGLRGDYYTVPNVVDTEVFFPGEKSNINDKKKILHISILLERHKNFSGILRAVKKLSEKRDDFELHVLGSGADKARQEQLAKELGLLGRVVFFYGDQPKHKVAEWLREASFLVLFSNYENLPCVMLESLASATPVLATDVGGITEHLNSRLGRVIKARDEEALVREMEFFLDHRADFNAAYLRQYAVDNFSEAVIGEKFLKIYIEVVMNHEL